MRPLAVALRLFAGSLVLAACAHGTEGGVGGAGQGGTPGAGGQGSSSSTSSGTPPADCATANDAYGCCDGSGTLYFCFAGATAVTKKVCTTGKECGWNAAKGYYDCVAAPGGTDPAATHPMACP